MTSRPDPRALNRKLARAFGITNLEDVREIVITLNPHGWPTVTVERLIIDDIGALTTTVTALELVPQAQT